MADTLTKPHAEVSGLSVPLDRDVFLRTLIRELSGALEDIVGIEEAAGYISLVDAAMGEQMNEDYVSSLGAAEGREYVHSLKP